MSITWYPRQKEYILKEYKGNLLVSICAYSSCFIKFIAVDIRVVIKCSVLAFNGPTPFLVLEMPVKTCEGTVLLTFMLKKLRALFDSKLFEISVKKWNKLVLMYSDVLRFKTLLVQSFIRFIHTCNERLVRFAVGLMVSY